MRRNGAVDFGCDLVHAMTGSAPMADTGKAPKRHGGGQVSKATEENLAQVLAIVETGVGWKRAAEAIGVGQATILRWRNAPATRGLFARARAVGEARMVALLLASEQGHKGAQFVLERSYRGRWAKRSEVTVKAKPIESLSLEAAKAEMKALVAKWEDR
jgi:hypothetical protein